MRRDKLAARILKRSSPEEMAGALAEIVAVLYEREDGVLDEDHDWDGAADRLTFINHAISEFRPWNRQPKRKTK